MAQTRSEHSVDFHCVGWGDIPKFPEYLSHVANISTRRFKLNRWLRNGGARTLILQGRKPGFPRGPGNYRFYAAGIYIIPRNSPILGPPRGGPKLGVPG